MKIRYVKIHIKIINKTVTCSAVEDVSIPSKAITARTQVFPVPDFACTTRSIQQQRINESAINKPFIPIVNH